LILNEISYQFYLKIKLEKSPINKNIATASEYHNPSIPISSYTENIYAKGMHIKK
jgi:hypothetical protein